MTTQTSDLELAIPTLRAGSFLPSLLERRRRIDQALYAVIMAAYVHGVSTRSVDDLVKTLGSDTGISKDEVSRICVELGKQLDAFHTRPLDPIRFPYLFLDATYVKARVDHRIVFQAVVIATGVTPDGGREVVGVTVGDSESEDFWAQFLRHLQERRVSGVRLVISDSDSGLVKAIRKVMLGAAWQRCRVHFVRNVFAVIPKGSAEMVAACDPHNLRPAHCGRRPHPARHRRRHAPPTVPQSQRDAAGGQGRSDRVCRLSRALRRAVGGERTLRLDPPRVVGQRERPQTAGDVDDGRGNCLTQQGQQCVRDAHQAEAVGFVDVADWSAVMSLGVVTSPRLPALLTSISRWPRPSAQRLDRRAEPVGGLASVSGVPGADPDPLARLYESARDLVAEAPVAAGDQCGGRVVSLLCVSSERVLPVSGHRKHPRDWFRGGVLRRRRSRPRPAPCSSGRGGTGAAGGCRPRWIRR